MDGRGVNGGPVPAPPGRSVKKVRRTLSRRTVWLQQNGGGNSLTDARHR